VPLHTQLVELQEEVVANKAKMAKLKEQVTDREV